MVLDNASAFVLHLYIVIIKLQHKDFLLLASFLRKDIEGDLDFPEDVVLLALCWLWDEYPAC